MMPLVPMTNFLTSAKENKFAVGQFNVNNLEFVKAIIEAAEEERSPVIFGITEGAIKYMGMEFAIAITKAAADNYDVPVALHLDHGANFEIVMQCIRAGFSSVMFDGSHYPLEENIRLTKKVVESAHAVNVSVEGELGTIGGTEDDVNVDESQAKLADPAEAIYFWEETKVDALAIAVGTAHGLYKGQPRIRFDIIDKVARHIPIPIVLHGGSGVPDDAIRKSIDAGVAKINVGTELQMAITRTVRNVLDEDAEIIDIRQYLRPGCEAMKEVIKKKMRLFRSSHQA